MRAGPTWIQIIQRNIFLKLCFTRLNVCHFAPIHTESKYTWPSIFWSSSLSIAVCSPQFVVSNRIRKHTQRAIFIYTFRVFNGHEQFFFLLLHKIQCKIMRERESAKWIMKSDFALWIFGFRFYESNGFGNFDSQTQFTSTFKTHELQYLSKKKWSQHK